MAGSNQLGSNTKYDVVVIGGGHNGLVNAAYLARAGKKVLVLERRHVLGGAACTEEIVPGFKFSVCSYVVSLLRPEIIRDLDLPRHGLEILPLDGTFTPMPSGDYLWRVNDHGPISCMDLTTLSGDDTEERVRRLCAKVIKAIVPLAEMFGYATHMRSSTQGRAEYSMRVAPRRLAARSGPTHRVGSGPAIPGAVSPVRIERRI